MKCCEEYAAALSAFADGELNEAERRTLLDHIEHCQRCRDYLSELMILRAMFEEMPELQAPDNFAGKVLERIHEEERARKRRRRFLPRVLAACAAFVLVAGAAVRFALPDADTGSDSAVCGDNGAAEDVPLEGIALAPTGDDYTSFSYSAVQKDGAQYDDQYAPDGEAAADAPTADGAAGGTERQEYLTVCVDEAAAEDFLLTRGMAVYSETEESVRFLVTPEVAHELGAETLMDEDTAAALAGANALVIVEIGRAQPNADAGADGETAPDSGGTLPDAEEGVAP